MGGLSMNPMKQPIQTTSYQNVPTSAGAVIPPTSAAGASHQTTALSNGPSQQPPMMGGGPPMPSTSTSNNNFGMPPNNNLPPAPGAFANGQMSAHPSTVGQQLPPKSSTPAGSIYPPTSMSQPTLQQQLNQQAQQSPASLPPTSMAGGPPTPQVIPGGANQMSVHSATVPGLPHMPPAKPPVSSY